MTGKIGKADFTLTIRMKIEIIFLVFVLVLSTINIGSFSAARSSIGKFDNMIETMLIINSINNTSIGITGLLKDYQTSKKGDVEQKINDSIKVIVDDMRYLQKAVNGKALLETLQRVVGNFQESVATDIEVIKASNSGEIIDNQPKMETLNGLVNRHATMLLLNELNYSNSLKRGLEKSTNSLGLIIVLCLVSIGLIGLCAAYVFSGRIVKPIMEVSKMLLTISKGEGDLTQNLKIREMDEIGYLFIAFQ